jgi:2-keto-3-deoxy-L-rhamnonate aldolase RhmA
MGMAGRFDTASFWNAAGELAEASRRNGVAAGFLDASAALLERMIGLGFRVIGCGTDVVLLREGLRAGLSTARTFYHQAAPPER